MSKGGAVLVAAGPDYASSTSLFPTPLEVVLPAQPSGQVTETPFRPKITNTGGRHPVRRELPEAGRRPAALGPLVPPGRHQKGQGGTGCGRGRQAAAGAVARGEGRVALLMSDHVWLWARGYEGGGPGSDLLRRLSHWLMKEPDLEEEALRLSAHGRELSIERQSMADTIGEVTVTAPSGTTTTLTLQSAQPGLWRGSMPAGRTWPVARHRRQADHPGEYRAGQSA